MAHGRGAATVRPSSPSWGPSERIACSSSAPTARHGSTRWFGNAPHAVRCLDLFHVVQWATEALDEGRQCGTASGAAGAPSTQRISRALGGHSGRTRGSHLEAEDDARVDLGGEQAALRAYLLKGALRAIFRALSLDKATEKIDACDVPPENWTAAGLSSSLRIGPWERTIRCGSRGSPRSRSRTRCGRPNRAQPSPSSAGRWASVSGPFTPERRSALGWGSSSFGE